MLEVKTKINGVTKRYVVYESHAEALENGIVVEDIRTAQPGDYVRTDNDYVIPLLSREIIRKSRYGDFKKLRFPNLIWNNMQWYDNNNFRQMPFVWSREPKPTKPRVFVTARQKLFAMYLAKGMDIYAAFNAVFTPQKSRAKKEQLLKQILDNPNFANYMKESGLMESLKDTYKDVGIDDKWLAEQLKKLVESPETNYNTKNKALDMISQVLGTSIQSEIKSADGMDELRDKFKITKVS